ncbi:MAG: T9SS type A sorting domain-containing protein, partial [Bacteroidales bacterium]|nr:T9SS type A sorting domain-containing protein [Bacteroidales bacterium]
FNYEARGCANPSLEPEYNTMVGADKRANGGDEASSGSDFYLVELNNMIPNYINAYYNGWSRTGEAASSGVSIHHPQGDIKKISTFSSKLNSTGFGTSDLESHWKVTWSSTENGYGVTEPGSSGSPIFDQSGLVVGSLTGGNAGCGADTNQPDYYGKFSYSWERNGNRPEDRLKDWLDPNNQGVSSLSGLAHGEEPLPTIANFSTEDTTIVIGGVINFSNLVVGAINEYKWTFEGAEPNSSTDVNPGPVHYKNYGSYDVKLEVSGPDGSADTVKKDYIRVIAKAYPNPVADELTLDFGKDPITNLSVWVYNSMGLLIHEVEKKDISQTTYKLDMSTYDSGIYFVRVNADDEISKYKVVKRKRK